MDENPRRSGGGLLKRVRLVPLPQDVSNHRPKARGTHRRETAEMKHVRGGYHAAGAAVKRIDRRTRTGAGLTPERFRHKLLK